MTIKRRLILGDEWVYYKIYSSVGIQNSLLLNEIYNLIYQLFNDGIIKKFYFVRFTDKNGPHLRLRFLLTQSDNLCTLIIKLNKKIGGLVEKRIINRVTTDTYIRELERYGEKNIEDIETMFTYNSLITMNLLKEMKDSELLWIKSIQRIDELLTCLKFTSHDKYKIFETLFINFSALHDINSYTKDLLKKKLRAYKLEITSGLSLNWPIIYKAPKSLAFNEEFSVLQKLAKAPRNKFRLNQLLQDLIHMNFNRLFLHNQNLLECVIYFMMSNHYKSCYMREDEQRRKTIGSTYGNGK